jgi:KaiC/GvpD/RAD55 family RecA-like ATPase
MHGEELIERSPMRALAAEIRGGLDAGQVGGVFARAGVGKSAFLVQIAMTYALRGNPVLHVSLTDGQARVRSFYDELLAEVSRAVSVRDRSAAQVELERNRVIHASLGRPFGPGDLEALVGTLSEVMHFRPIAVVVDGSDVSGLDVDG